MSEIATIGLDIVKNVFQLHGVVRNGNIVLRRALRRSQLPGFFGTLPPCLIGMEACATAHHWARTLVAFGHEVRLIHPAYVKPYLRRQKNDAADAAAICEAVMRPSKRSVPVKSVQQQSTLMLHGVRELLVGQRTALINPKPSSGRVERHRRQRPAATSINTAPSEWTISCTSGPGD